MKEGKYIKPEVQSRYVEVPHRTTTGQTVFRRRLAPVVRTILGQASTPRRGYQL